MTVLIWLCDNSFAFFNFHNAVVWGSPQTTALWKLKKANELLTARKTLNVRMGVGLLCNNNANTKHRCKGLLYSYGMQLRFFIQVTFLTFFNVFFKFFHVFYLKKRCQMQSIDM